MYKALSCLVVLLGMSSIPLVVHGQVVISEIAWMGTNAATNAHYCEWVELHNQGTERVSLSGWKLATADGGMNASLTGSIDAGMYFVVERYTANACPDPISTTNDLSVSFGGGLSNSGELVILTDAGTEVDRIDAAGGWDSIGGDADEKYTAQRSGAGWVTAVPTPGAVNATESVAIESTVSEKSTSSTASTKVSNPVPDLVINPGTDRVVSTHAHTQYRATVYDSTKKIYHHPHVTWAFGDGAKGIGRETDHRYVAPGEYLVVVRAQEGYAAGTHSFTVMVDDAKVAIAAVSEQGITLINQNTRVVDLSEWLLEAGGERYRLPRDTSILPGRSVLIPRAVTGLTATSSASLLYPDEEVAEVFSTDTKPSVSTTSSHTVRKVDALTAIETPRSHDVALVTPPATADPVAGGVLHSLATLITSWFWPEFESYRRLLVLV